MEKYRTKLMEAYITLTEDYSLDSMSASMLKEELENILDVDLTVSDFDDIIRQNAMAYRVFLHRYNPNNDTDFLLIDSHKIGEISIEPRQGEDAIYNGLLYY